MQFAVLSQAQTVAQSSPGAGYLDSVAWPTCRLSLQIKAREVRFMN